MATINKKKITMIMATCEVHKDWLGPVRTGFFPVRELIEYGLTANRTMVRL